MSTEIILQAIEDGVERVTEQGHRNHLGASVIGKPCSRELWYIFYWAKASKFKGRMLRLFQRGHQEEFVFEKLLKDIGCEVWTVDANNNQFKCSDCHGHFGGSLDGVAKGIPTLPQGEPALLEFKTHSEKSFKKLEKEGLVSAKYEHFVQQQIYMYKFGLNQSLYMAVNKNTDHLFLDIVLARVDVAKDHLKRAYDIIFSKLAPKRINESPAFFGCRFCNFKGICHSDEQAEVNCRTCIHSQPIQNAQWHCGKYNQVIGKELMITGCGTHEYRASLKK